MSRYKLFDRSKLNVKSVLDRKSKSDISIMIDPDSTPPRISSSDLSFIERIAKDMREARKNGANILLAYGAHLFKNGCAPILIGLMERGYVQHLLTNGAGIIHDFEMSLFGRTEEDVREYIEQGQFGIWEETGKTLNQCIIGGAANDEGLGECVGKMIHSGSLEGRVLDFPNKGISIVGNAFRLNIPLGSCIGVGYDIINTHPLCDGASLGKASYTDFLMFANSVSGLEKGVMLSVGSAIMAPMVFEKSLSMAKNLAVAEGKKLDKYSIFVNDIQPGTWDWSKGDPPKDNPAYFLRFCKSFSRMGGDFSYLCLDNRKFLHNLYHILK